MPARCASRRGHRRASCQPSCMAGSASQHWFIHQFTYTSNPSPGVAPADYTENVGGRNVFLCGARSCARSHRIWIFRSFMPSCATVRQTGHTPIPPGSARPSDAPSSPIDPWVSAASDPATRAFLRGARVRSAARVAQRTRAIRAGAARGSRLLEGTHWSACLAVVLRGPSRRSVGRLPRGRANPYCATAETCRTPSASHTPPACRLGTRARSRRARARAQTSSAPPAGSATDTVPWRFHLPPLGRSSLNRTSAHLSPARF